jgi:hypothetical protein
MPPQGRAPHRSSTSTNASTSTSTSRPSHVTSRFPPFWRGDLE